MSAPMSEAREKRYRLIRQVLKAQPHQTEFFRAEGRCTLAEAVVELMRHPTHLSVREAAKWT